MPKFLTHLRLPLLALLAGFALASCHNKKEDPKPVICFPDGPMPTGGGN